MQRTIILLTAVILIFSAALYAQEAALVHLDGIAEGMKKRELVKNWGYPSKRDYVDKEREDIWYYLNEKSPYPTDGVLVYFYKGKVANWKVVENIYSEMAIWGRDVGVNP